MIHPYLALKSYSLTDKATEPQLHYDNNTINDATLLLFTKWNGALSLIWKP